MKFWPDVLAYTPRSLRRKALLEEMGAWRNAIAHQDFSNPSLQGRTLQLQQVRSYRAACWGLAKTFDWAVLAHIKAVVGPKAGW